MDEFDNYACRRLVSIGSNGSDGGKHAQKNLLRMIGDDLGFDKFVTSIAGEGTIRDCILPSTWFQLLARRPHKFINHLGAREHDVRKFWTGLFKSERGQRLRSAHPMLTGRSPESLKHCIPLAVHEDAGPFSKRRSTNIINIGSVLGSGTDIECRYPIASYLKSAGDAVDSGLLGWEALFQDLSDLFHGDIIIVVEGISWSFVLTFGEGDMEVLCVPLGAATLVARRNMFRVQVQSYR